MVELAAFQASANALDLDRSVFNTMSVDPDPEAGCLLAILFVPYSWARAQFQQMRLNRVLRAYPYSLYCPGCGHITKRRFKPVETE
jgi:hypothetical protein